MVSTGIKQLDKILGEYPNDGITTIYGPAKSGKTNLILTTAIQIIKNNKKIIVINTEGEIIADRINQLTNNIKSFMFLNPKTFNEQDKIIKQICNFSLSNIGMIVFDSSNKLLRAESSTENKKKFKQQLLLLKDLARQKKIPVLITAQVYHSYNLEEEVIFAGDIINEFSDCIFELTVLNKVRKITLKKHSNTAGEKIFLFKIKEKGIEPFIKNCTKD